MLHVPKLMKLDSKRKVKTTKLFQKMFANSHLKLFKVLEKKLVQPCITMTSSLLKISSDHH